MIKRDFTRERDYSIPLNFKAEEEAFRNYYKELKSGSIVAQHFMKVVYIAHPIGGDVEGNLEKVKIIGREINLNEPEVVPFAPYFFDCHILDDNIPEERARGFRNDEAFFRAGIIDEVRLYGPQISEGMRKEIDLALELGIEVKAMTYNTRMELNEITRV